MCATSVTNEFITIAFKQKYSDMKMSYTQHASWTYECITSIHIISAIDTTFK